MSRCENKVDQTVPSGWDYKTITMSCGSTGIHGQTLYCDQCHARFAKRGHDDQHCKHGTFLYPEDGRDVMCPGCEMGD